MQPSAVPDMAGSSVPAYHAFWRERRASLQAEYKDNIKQYPEADDHYRRLFKSICDIEDLASFTPATIGESVEWTAIINAAEENRESYCKALTGKILFSALYGTYTVALNDLKALVKAKDSQTKPSQEEDFKEVRRRKRQNTTESAPTTKKAAAAAGSTQTKEVPTQNYFAPLRVTSMETDTAGAGTTTLEEGATTLEVETSGKAGRPPPNNINVSSKPDPVSKTIKKCGQR